MTSTYLRRSALGALAATALAAAAVPYLSASPTAARQAAEPSVPPTFNLDAEPAALLPATVDAATPVTVVTTVRDAAGRPVITARKVTDRTSAEALIRSGQRTPGAIGVELDAPAAATGSDTYRTWQWDLAQLAVAETWPLSTGAGVTVAVIDSGVDGTHPDLAGNVLPGVDYVDDGLNGWSDVNGHGTHVAGTVAAVTGNDVGIAGIAPDARILPVRTLDGTGRGWMSDVATGIVYAADNGAQVVNMSLASSQQTGSVTQAIAYARGKGVVVVAAAGNDRGTGSPAAWPAADNGVIAVASTTSADAYSTFSNQGSYVDVAAPGSSILSTTPPSHGTYAYYDGTSMASPHVAAAAALLKARDPQLSPDQVENLLESTAVDLGTPGWDQDFGYGRIRPLQALQQLSPSPSPTTPDSPSSSVVPTTDPPAATVPASSEPPASATPVPSEPPASTTPVPSAPPETVPPTSSAPVVVHPVVTSTATSRTVGYGSVISTAFTVQAGGTAWAGKTVMLCTSGLKGAFRCTATKTSDAGTVQHVRTATGGFRVFLYAPSGPGSTSATSATYTYVVRAKADLHRTGSRSLTATIGGATGQAARLQRLDGTRWRTVVEYRATASRTVSGLRPGARYRLSVASTAAVEGAESRTAQL